METRKSNVKVRNWMNYDPENDDTFEAANKLPSMTVPDLSMSVKEIVERSQMGLPPEGERIPIFDENDPIPNIERLDLAERQQFIKYYQDEIKRLTTPQAASDAVMAQIRNDRTETAVLQAAENDKLLKD